MTTVLERQDVRRFLIAAGYRPGSEQMVLRELAQFAEWLEGQGYTWASIDWRACVRAVNRRGEELGLIPVDRETIEAYLQALRARRPTVGALQQAHMALSSYFTYMVGMGVLRRSPVAGISLPPRPRITKPALTREELERLLCALRQTEGGAEMLALAETLVETGLRIGEALKLRQQDVLADEGMVRLYDAKTADFELRALTERAAKIIEAWQHNPVRPTSAWIFPDPRRPSRPLAREIVRMALHRAAQQAGVKVHVTPHTLRRTFATLLAQEGAPEDEIRQALGHKDVAVLPFYVDPRFHGTAAEIALANSRLARLWDTGRLP